MTKNTTARRVRYSAAMSLDGFIAGPHGEFDWITMDPDIDFGALFSRYDTVLMGRKSYDAARQQSGGGAMQGMKTFVFSTTLQQKDCGGVTLSDQLAQTVASLKGQPGKDIWLFGGGSLFRSLLEIGLVDEVEVAIVPVLLGAGIRFLPDRDTRSTLALTKHQVFEKTGTVLLEYRVTKQKQKRLKSEV